MMRYDSSQSTSWIEQALQFDAPAGKTTAILVPAAEVDATWLKREEELLRAAQLCHDWDGEGSEAPDPELIDTAFKLMRRLRRSEESPPSRLSISTNGTIVLAWRRRGTYTEVEIEWPNREEWMEKVPGQPARHWIWPPKAPRIMCFEEASQGRMWAGLGLISQQFAEAV